MPSCFVPASTRLRSVLREVRDEETLLDRWTDVDKLDLVIECRESLPEPFFTLVRSESAQHQRIAARLR